MHKLKYLTISVILAMSLSLASLPFDVSARPLAATAPGLGYAGSFSILSSTYTNTAPGTIITGDLGYTTGPAVVPTVNGTTHSADPTYAQAGLDQGAALANLNGQGCTFTFPDGAVDLATAAHGSGSIGNYLPGVYCTTATSAASIGTGGITLTASGTYIFRIFGALTSVANSGVTLAAGVSPCDVFWTPTGATTLGANSTFEGTDIDAAGITIGSTVTWTGRALAFGGTVTTDSDTINRTVCALALPTLTTTASGPVTVGGLISDTAHLVGGSGILTGTLTFAAFAPGDTTCATSVISSTAAVNGAGDYLSANYASILVGDYHWTARYSGDANNLAVNTACNDAGETSTVNAAPTGVPPTSVPAANTPVPLTATPALTAAPALTATLLPIVTGLPATGGAPIRSEDFPWSLVIIAGGFSAMALVLGIRVYRSTYRPKQ